MAERRVDTLARTLAGGSRRDLLRAGVGAALAGILAARSPEAAFAALPPIPDASNDYWPVCSDPAQHYCVEAFTANGVDLLHGSSPPYQGLVVATRDVVTPGPADRLQWSVLGAQDRMTPDDAGTEFRFVVRCGRLEPTVTFMRATGAELWKSGEATSGWRLEVRGRPSIMPHGNDPLGGGVATTLWTEFDGMSLHRQAPTLSMWEGFEGYMSTSGAHSYSPPYRRGDGWFIVLRGYHFWPDGVTLNQGSYQAWVSPQSLQTLGLTVRQAVAGGLAVSRIDDGVESVINAVIAADAGGVKIEIPDLTFSSPTIAIRKRGKGGCAKKCRKGRTCKNGRCVKKKRRKH
ncbi:MAG: hypothetical protein U0Z70_05515 [Thermomicrobiales bacterium]